MAAMIGKWFMWLVAAAVAIVLTAGGAYYLTRHSTSPEGGVQDVNDPPSADQVRLEVVHPLKGAMPRISTGPGSVQAFESADLVAGASGYLKSQTVDIGDRVTVGKVLAQVDVPDLEKQVQHQEATLEAAQAHVAQMEAHVVSTKADVLAAKAEIVRANAAIDSTHAKAVFREKQFQRMYALYHAPGGASIDERLVDEHQDDRDAAVAAENEAHAELAKANAMVAAADAKVLASQADVTDAKADVKVAQAELEKAQVMVQFATIRSPYTGVITYRAKFPGDYVKAATDASSSRPLLTVQRTDKMRVVFQMPDHDVPYCNKGDRAVVEIDALPGPPLEAKVSRLANSEDVDSLLMHVEIDLDNPTGKIAQGMFGHVTIYLDQGADLLSVPSSSLTGKVEKGNNAVFVVRNGKAHLTPVVVGTDNGVRIAVLKGLKADDEVVLQPDAELADGAAVVASPAAYGDGKTH